MNCDGRIVKNFSLTEMANNQAKDSVKLVLTEKVVRQAVMMQRLRDYWGKPMTVNSWYRTLAFNSSCGGSKNSCHLDGMATDIALPSLSDKDRDRLIEVWRSICIQTGVIGGVSIYNWGLHFDSNDDPKRFNSGASFRISDYR